LPALGSGGYLQMLDGDKRITKTQVSRRKSMRKDILLSAFKILIKYVKKNKQISGFNIKIEI